MSDRHFRSFRRSLITGMAVLGGLARPALGASPADSIPAHDAFTIASRGLGELRTINVYTPPGYAATRKPFPVLYMPDGGLAEDFPHVVNTVDSLIRLERIAPVIVVGIENIERRKDLTGPTVVKTDSAIAPHVGGSAAFRRFIRDELMPEVRKRYRTTGERSIVGESLAGYFVVETMLQDPGLFRGYIALSPALWWNAGEQLRVAGERLGRLSDSKRRLYLAAANEPGIEAETATLAGLLESEAPGELAWEYHPRPDLRHDTIFRALAPEAFVRILGSGSRAGGRIVTDTLHSQALRGNRIRDTPDREITIYLPPGYQREPSRRFPVLYLLHGITSAPVEWLDGSYQGMNLRLTMDSLIAGGMTEYIVVMPFADNSYGGSFYVNSTAFGRWEDFVAKELVRFVETRYRTLPDRLNRGLAGQSMGGFGALYLAGRHPGTFGHVYGMSPCCLGFMGELAPESPAWRPAGANGSAASGAMSAAPRWLRTMEAAFAPASDTAGPAIPALAPFAADSSGLVAEIEPISRAWRKFLPLERLRRDARPYRTLCSIALEFGREDQIASVRLGVAAFGQELARARIRHSLDEFTGGHVDHVRERFAIALLPFFGRAFAAAGARGRRPAFPGCLPI